MQMHAYKLDYKSQNLMHKKLHVDMCNAFTN